MTKFGSNIPKKLLFLYSGEKLIFFLNYLYREMSSMDVAKLLVLASEAMRCIDPVKSKHLVQKAIHTNPLCREAWAAKQLMCS